MHKLFPWPQNLAQPLIVPLSESYFEKFKLYIWRATEILLEIKIKKKSFESVANWQFHNNHNNSTRNFPAFPSEKECHAVISYAKVNVYKW